MSLPDSVSYSTLIDRQFVPYTIPNFNTSKVRILQSLGRAPTTERLGRLE